MLSFERALSFAWALWKLCLSFPGDVFTIALFLMTWLAEMSVTPTEPLGDWATKFAFEVDEVCTVLRTGFGATSHLHWGTLAADQLFFLECKIVLVCLVTVFHSSKIWLLARVAHVIWKFSHSIVLKLSVKSVAWLRDSLMFVEVLEFCTLHGLLDDFFFKFFLLEYLLV